MSAALPVLRIGHTHLYPGARGRLGGEGPAAGTGNLLVAFSDGVEVPARLEPGENGPALSVAGHMTAKGTPIPAKRWRIEMGPASEGEAPVRVAARLG